MTDEATVEKGAAAGWTPADFFTMAVHELRTSLTAIDGHAQFVERFLVTDPRKAATSVSQVREQSKRMNRLISDLLEQARASVGALSLDVVTFDLRSACEATIRLYEPDDPPRISFRGPDTDVRVRGDPDRIAGIIGNLLQNATKYSAAGSPIDVSLGAVGGDAVLLVTDRGVGIPDADLGRVFTPFYRTTRTREIPGTGLGLHISRRVAELHGGRLWLEWTSGAGSTFALSLPLAPATAST